MKPLRFLSPRLPSLFSSQTTEATPTAESPRQNLFVNMASALDRLKTVWRRHGWRMFGPLVWHNVRYYSKRLLRPGRSGPALSSVDQIPGVETQLSIQASALGQINENSTCANAYQPIAESAFDAAVRALPLNPGDFNFVDLGSGKGRALLLAAKFEFRRIMGVEYSERLHQQAQNNLRAAQGAWPNTDRIELIHGDAIAFVPPVAPTVLYLYNPFGAKVMAGVMANWSAWMETHAHPVWVIYATPEETALFEQNPLLKHIRTLSDCAIYCRRASPTA